MVSKKLLISVMLLSLIPLYANAESGTIPVTANGNSYSIDFETDGVTISGVTADMNFISLIFTVEVTGSPGILEVTFQREYFDTVIGGQDEPFIVLADGDEPKSEETKTTTESRTLRIELDPGTEELEIIGEQLLDGTFGSMQIMEEPIETEEPTQEEPTMEEPTTEEPTTEEPTTEEPTTEEPTETVPDLECGPGTMLKDGVCVLDERCGPGTHFEDGLCVLDEKKETPSTGGVSVDFGGGKGYSQLVISAIVAFGIALAVIIILAIIAHGRKKKQTQAY